MSAATPLFEGLAELEWYANTGSESAMLQAEADFRLWAERISGVDLYDQDEEGKA